MKRGRPKGVKNKSRKVELLPRKIKNNRNYDLKPKCAFDGCLKYARRANGYCLMCSSLIADGVPTPQEIEEMNKEMGRIAVNNLGFLHSLMIEAPFGLTPVDYRAARAQDNGITPEEKEE